MTTVLDIARSRWPAYSAAWVPAHMRPILDPIHFGSRAAGHLVVGGDHYVSDRHAAFYVPTAHVDEIRGVVHVDAPTVFDASASPSCGIELERRSEEIHPDYHDRSDIAVVRFVERAEGTPRPRTFFCQTRYVQAAERLGYPSDAYWVGRRNERGMLALLVHADRIYAAIMEQLVRPNGGAT